MASSADYSAIPSTGKLKLKGVKDSKIEKKKKKKSSKAEDGAGAEHGFKDKSVMLKKLEDEDAQMKKESRTDTAFVGRSGSPVEDEDEELGQRIKTEAQRRYDEQRRKRLDERLKREGVKTHKQRVEELNRYLSGLSEHHDMPRIGPG